MNVTGKAKVGPAGFGDFVTCLNRHMFAGDLEPALGFRLVDRQSENKAVAARSKAGRKIFAHLSERVATIRHSLKSDL